MVFTAGVNPATGLMVSRPGPVRSQLRSVRICPLEDEAAGACRQLPGDQLQSLDSNGGLVFGTGATAECVDGARAGSWSAGASPVNRIGWLAAQGDSHPGEAS